MNNSELYFKHNILRYNCANKDTSKFSIYRLSHKILEHKKEIKNAEILIRELHSKIKNLQSICFHEAITQSPWGSAKCNICDKEFSWYCPESPTLECDYEYDNGDYNDDCCKYCAEPEERK